MCHTFKVLHRKTSHKPDVTLLTYFVSLFGNTYVTPGNISLKQIRILFHKTLLLRTEFLRVGQTCFTERLIGLIKGDLTVLVIYDSQHIEYIKTELILTLNYPKYW
jgi:hypothetical protein